MPYHPDGHQPIIAGPSGTPPFGGSGVRRPDLPAQRLIIEFSPAVERAMERIADALEGLNLSGVIMSQEMDDLVSQVERNTTVVGSVADAFAGIKAKLDEVTAELSASGVDTAKLTSLSAQLSANTDKLAAAVVTNTPAAPAPVVDAPVADPAPVVDASAPTE